MTPDELDALHYRYRAPAVAALPNGYFAVYTIGMDPPIRYCLLASELHEILTEYMEWNALKTTPARPSVSRPPKAAAKAPVETKTLDDIEDLFK